MDFDIIPRTLTFTAGTRFYRFDNTEVGSDASSFGCYEAGPPPCTNGASNLNAKNLRSHYDGTRSRLNLTWKITPDTLLYYTFSQGFRPGGFNRSSYHSTSLDYTTPLAFAPDTLTNNEIGAKTEWFDHRLQINTALYQEDWTNVQTTFFDPTGSLGNQTFETNGPSYRVRGIEVQLVGRVTRELTLTGSAAWNSSNQTDSPYLISDAGQPILSIPNPFGALGSSLAMSPPFEGNLRARYEFSYMGYLPFVQVGLQHVAHSYSATGYFFAYNQSPYTNVDASAGISRNQWSLQLYCTNVTDKRADLYTSDYESVVAETVSRPRTAGLKFSYKFSEK